MFHFLFFRSLLAQITPDIGFDVLAKMALDAITSGRWALLAALLVVLLVLAGEKWGSGLIPFLGTDPGKALMALVLGVAGGIANTLLALGTAAVTWAVVLKGAEVGFMAAGGLLVLENLWTQLIWPWLKSKLFPAPPVAPVP